jgi:restriction endonuclease S subunit
MEVREEALVMEQRLGDLAQIYRGRVILKEDLNEQGSVSVLNVSNINDEEIQFGQMDVIRLIEPEMSKYRVNLNDLIVTARGTRFKSGIVRALPPQAVILSANLLGLRFSNPAHAEYLNIYFRTALGSSRIEGSESGNGGINLGKKNLEELVIPMMNKIERETLVEEFKREQQAYLRQVESARERWIHSRQRLFSCLEKGSYETAEPAERTPLRNRENRQKDRLFIELD